MNALARRVASLREWLSRLSATVNPRRSDLDLENELRLHLDLAAERAGTDDPREARRQAALAVGGVAQAMEQLRDQRELRWLADIGRDLRYGARVLVNDKAFAAAAIVALGLACGAATTMFSALNAVLIRPLPYPETDRLVYVGTWNAKFDSMTLPSGSLDAIPPSHADFADLQRQATTFASLAEFDVAAFNATDGNLATLLGGARVSGDFFSTLGVRPTLGRAVDGADVRTHAPAAVISHGLWQSAFGGDVSVLHRPLTLNGDRYEIVGVMPAAFGYPEASDVGHDAVSAATDVWVPLALTPAQQAERDISNNTAAFGRLKPGTTLEQARAETATLVAQLDAGHSPFWQGAFAVVAPFTEQLLHAARRPLWLLAGAVFLLLLIACSNVAHLLVARGLSRSHELFVRRALGSSRARLIRQLTTESLMVSLAAGLLGTALAAIGVRVIPWIDPGGIPRLNLASLDWRVLAFSVALVVVTPLLFGLLPAITLSGVHASTSMAPPPEGRVTAAAKQLRRGLLALQIGLAVTLLTGSLLLIRSYANVVNDDRGFSSSTLTLRVTFDQRYRANMQSPLFVRRLLERIRALPGVQHAGAVTALPLSHSDTFSVFEVEGGPDTRNQFISTPRATGEYFDAMNTRLIEGRRFTDVDADEEHGGDVVIVNQAFARRYMPGRTAVGGHFRVGTVDGTKNRWSTVIGVVRDVKHSTVDQGAEPQVYAPLFQLQQFNSFYVAIGTSVDATDMTNGVRHTLYELDPLLAVSDVHVMGERVTEALALRRFQTALIATFAIVSVMLTATGLFASMAYSIRQRRSEMGIRLALGATARHLAAAIVGESVAVLAAGFVLGTVGGWLVAKTLGSLLFGVAPADPAAVLGTLALLVIVAGAASVIPLRRLLATDPLAVLRRP